MAFIILYHCNVSPNICAVRSDSGSGQLEKFLTGGLDRSVSRFAAVATAGPFFNATRPLSLTKAGENRDTCCNAVGEAAVQFTMKYLFGLTAIAAIVCVALVFATAWWAAVAFTVSIVLLLASLVFCFAVTGDRRWYWIGFAIFGWGYWIVLSLPLLSLDGTLGQWQLGGSRLVSEKILEWVYFRALPLVHVEPQVDQKTGEVLNGSRYPNGTDFMRIGHSLAALLAAVFGGVIGRSAYRRFRSSKN